MPDSNLHSDGQPTSGQRILSINSTVNNLCVILTNSFVLNRELPDDELQMACGLLV